MTAAANSTAKRLTAAREHLAGIKAARVWQQDLAAAHLLRTEAPISDQPAQGESKEA